MRSAARRTPGLRTVVVSLVLGSCMPADAAVLYRMQEESTLERGCFPPCRCPTAQASVSGSFELALITVGDVFDFYEVTDVSWLAMFEAGDRTLTGAGMYQMSPIIEQQVLNLDLALDDAPPEHYSSDIVPLGAPFPDIAVQISVNGGICFDTMVDVRSKPTPRLQVGRDELTWDSGLEIVGYDVVLGSLTVLRDSGGSFELATDACLANDLPASSMHFDAQPVVGEGFWLLVRVNGSTYDTDMPSEVASRDPGIAASGVACP